MGHVSGERCAIRRFEDLIRHYGYAHPHGYIMLKIALYTDECTPGNVLGVTTKECMCLYWTLLNFPSQFRSREELWYDCIYVSTCGYKCICRCVNVYVQIYTYISVYIYIYIYTYTYINTYRINMNEYIYIYIHTHMNVNCWNLYTTLRRSGRGWFAVFQQ